MKFESNQSEIEQLINSVIKALSHAETPLDQLNFIANTHGWEKSYGAYLPNPDLADYLLDIPVKHHPLQQENIYLAYQHNALVGECYTVEILVGDKKEDLRFSACYAHFVEQWQKHLGDVGHWAFGTPVGSDFFSSE